MKGSKDKVGLKNARKKHGLDDMSSEEDLTMEKQQSEEDEDTQSKTFSRKVIFLYDSLPLCYPF